MDTTAERTETETGSIESSAFQTEIIETYRKWQECLERDGKDLLELTRTTEQDFLSIGEKLQGFYIRARDISKSSSSATQLMVGEEITGAIDGLQKMLDQMSGYLQESETESEKIKGILDKILVNLSTIYEPLSTFKKIVKNLRVIGILTRVESSRLSHNKNDFNSLVEDVNKLAEVIESKSENTFTQSEILDKLVTETINKVDELKTKQQKRTMVILGNTQSSLEALKEKHSRSSEASEEIEGSSEEISKSIGEVVSAMQFHDITRQKIEHVVEALEEAGSKINHNLSTGDVLTDSQTFIGSIRSVFRLQLGQTTDAKDDMMNAANNIIENLKKVAGSASNMSDEIKEMAGSTEESGSSFLSEIQSGISDVTSSLFENIEASCEFSEAISSVAGTVEKMSVFLKDIQEIGTEIELVALNAGIKAFRTGEEGAALSVLAESIQRLSADARQRTGIVFGILQRITSSAEGLKEGLGLNIEEKNKKVENMAQELEVLMNSLQSMNGDIISLLNKMNTDVQFLALDIDDSVASMTVHHLFEKKLQRVALQLEELIEDSCGLAPVIDEEEEMKGLDALEEKYTMESERKVHQSFVKPQEGDSSQEEEDVTEPFTDIGSIMDNDSNGDGLDDNIELF